jgi:predicted nuclease of predicted toxin-antitoxin system
VRSREEGAPPVVIQVRAGNSSTTKLVSLIRDNAVQITTAVQFGGPLLEVGFTRAAASVEPPELAG